jgi:hypothetical protein
VANRTYVFGTGGDLIALQPATGGRPLGYGTGTVTFAAGADRGTISAVIKLQGARTVSIAGSWHCASSGGPAPKPTGSAAN